MGKKAELLQCSPQFGEICILRRNSPGNAFAGKTKDFVTEPVEGNAADDPIRSLLFGQVCIIHHILALSKPI